MKRIDIDFVRRKRRPVIEATLLFAALVVLADRGATWRALAQERDQSAARVATLEQRIGQQARARAQVREPDPQTARRLAQDRKVLAALDYPWQQVLAIVERPDMQGVALLSFGYDTDALQARLSVEAADVPALGRYVAQLNEASAGNMPWQWYVAGYQLQSQNNPPTLKATVLTR